MPPRTTRLPLRPLASPSFRPSHPYRTAIQDIKPAPSRIKRLKTPKTPKPPAPVGPKTSPPSPVTATPPPPTAPRPPSPQRPHQRPFTPRIRQSIPFLVSLVLGLGAGAALSRYILSAPAEPGSKTDVQALEALEGRIEDLFLVKVFRGKCVAAGKAIRGESGTWREIDTVGRKGDDEKEEDEDQEKVRIGRVRAAELRFEKNKSRDRDGVRRREREIVAAGGVGDDSVNLGNKGGEEERLEGLRQQAEALGVSIDEGEEGVDRGADRKFRGSGITADALGGSRGLAVERVFWNAGEQELVAVVWLGKGLCGWPETVHGGLLATVLGEKVGMAAELMRREVLPSSRRREEGRKSQDDWDWKALKELEIQYKKPTYAGRFYVVRALPRLDEDGRDVEVEGTLETLEGKVCVQVMAKAFAPESSFPEAIQSTKPSPTGWLRWLQWS
ncbi:hypothetical protein CAC42_6651 [Sphaceloma murrayae]|uniref:Thioesterase domain-containing protein n=1 Tax=Sphaceloma murrayae TaxID=2082308 RepID=A0A2K1QG27_9PEZI|nr:hypothetical protein CAC42_6651 [Sphaceloma murrayae]